MTATDVENPQTQHLQRPEGRIAYHMARHEPLVVRAPGSNGPVGHDSAPAT